MQTKEERASARAEMLKNAGKRTAISGELLVTTELDGKSVTIPAVLLAAWPDKFRLELQDPVGGMLALVVVNGERFWLFEKERKENLTGPLKKIPFPLIPKGGSEDLLRLFLARPDLDSRKGGGRKGDTVEWDERLKEPLVWKRTEGTSKSVAIYEDYEFRDGARYPTKLRLSGPAADGKAREVTLVWKDWQASVPGEQKLFQIPQQQAFGRPTKALH